jgi:hypothetical protein
MSDLLSVACISFPDALLELIEAGLFVANQSLAIGPVVGTQRTDEAFVRVHCSLQLQHAGDGRKRGPGFSKR